MNKLRKIKDQIYEKGIRRVVLTTALFMSLFLFIVGISWSWFSALTLDGDVQGVTVETANLSIVFTDTNILKMENAIPGQSATKTFTVRNNGDKTAKYAINWEYIRNDFLNLEYKIESTNNSTSYAILPNDDSEHYNIINNISIAPGVTHTYTLTVNFKNKPYNQGEDDYEEGAKMVGKLEVVEEAIRNDNASNTFVSMLKTNNPPTNYSTIPGQQGPTTYEGLIEGPNDDYGNKTYYFRGDADNNWVIFNNEQWRIIRINGDNTVRLIRTNRLGLDTSIWSNEDIEVEEQSYNTNNEDIKAIQLAIPHHIYTTNSYNNANYMLTYGNSSIKKELENWYNGFIASESNLSSEVVVSKFCSDKSHTGNTKPILFGTSNRYNNSSYKYTPSFICPNSSDIYNLKVGTITADEALFTGIVDEEISDNNRSFLSDYNDDWWTMTPASWESHGILNAFLISYSNISAEPIRDAYYKIYPVISVRGDLPVTFDGVGNQGSNDNPYLLPGEINGR